MDRIDRPNKQELHNCLRTAAGVYCDCLTLAYRANDTDLPEVHGYPLRLVVPSMCDYKSVKWVDRIELADKRHIGYLERRGWPVDAWIR